MSSVVGFLATAGAVGAGFAAVYCPMSLAIKRWLANREAASEETPDSASDEQQAWLDAEQARMLVERLHEVAVRLSQHVDEHNTSVEEINAELLSLDFHDSERTVKVVLGAVDRIAQANSRLSERLSEAKDTIETQANLMEARMVDALTDPLTGIANRRAWDHELQRRLAEWQRKRKPLSLVMLDVDHFKEFNDTHGHQAGDEVLKGVAAILSQAMRDMDLVARYGGEEFSVILPDTDLSSAALAAERLRCFVESAEFPFEGTVLKLTTSVGLAEVLPGEDLTGFLRRADDALYASKRAGRNCGHLHNGTCCEPIGESAITANAMAPEAADVASDEGLSGAVADETASEQTPDVAPRPGRSARTDVDPVTGLATLTLFRGDLQRHVADWKRSGRPLSVVVFELDEAESIDQLGDEALTYVLDATAKLLRGASRTMDMLCRSGAVQFAIMLPDCDLQQAIVPAERVRRAAASCESLRYRGSPVRFTLSAGVAQAMEDDDGDALLRRSRAAAGCAAANGANRTYVHDGKSFAPASTYRTATEPVG